MTLFERESGGWQVIGMLPTGSGKTMVAAMLVRHMADDLIRTKRKVRTHTRLVPLVPTPAGLRSPEPPSRTRGYWVRFLPCDGASWGRALINGDHRGTHHRLTEASSHQAAALSDPRPLCTRWYGVSFAV